ncbi:hypothetical protein [Streptomyces sp. H27-H5]|uniref:hypothetical protein n=1 Tax=Streptomyces sp. H27-H5 TaxID=2996460 RepID=UPI0022711686|nr:hypothetical protein [Streptomyces sp. H27-H5]MCY0961818.1 hypothetical protein [Streptomyces sp. H27-H5]
MNSSFRTPGRPASDEPTSKSTTSASSSTGETGTDDAEDRRHAAALARSSTDQRSRADAALGEADEARGRAAEAAGRGDIATAGAEWSDAAGLDGLSAHEATGADIDARAAAAAAKSPSVPAAKKGGRRTTAGKTAPTQARGPERAPTPPPGAPRRNIA